MGNFFSTSVCLVVIYASVFVVASALSEGKTLWIPENPVSATECQEQVIHTVRAGDTLWGISELHYGDPKSWGVISKANGLLSDDLRIGQRLTIPVKR